MTSELALIEPLRAALAEATAAGDIDTLKDIASTATALQKGARLRGLGIEKENIAAEVILRAERAIGETLARMAENGERVRKGDNRLVDVERGGSAGELGGSGKFAGNSFSVPTLRDLGVERNEAHRFRLLAALPEDEFEARFATIRDSGARIAKVDFYRLVKPKPEPKPEAERDMHGDGYTSVYIAFHKAALDVLKGIDQMPEDELRDLAATIKQLVTAYNAERARR